ncbi:feruloyl-CoA synthase [Poseidonocella sedimentorum]|uniref:Feruloyl-CoA synthase n=1 Tax=Poseidonocella sedimentorum TaxID=871652 RepID=A0A1I6E4H4_9RHOB|nr:feruloyl-CoA synthase [Poseidonocella sedimentorum]SFR12674.1 feruloyl-CoA synthase [Poseidonocella sedimentorum]
MSGTGFWTPVFDIEKRGDGSILMRQNDPLTDHRPTLADALDHWAETAPDRPFLARRAPGGGDWRRISYGAARAAARAMGASLLTLGLGPDRPLLILSENSLEHALLGLACTCVGIPFAPVSPAYSLVSKDHRKLREIARTLRPGAVNADDPEAFAPALAALAARGRHVISNEDGPGRIGLETLRGGDPAGAEEARAGVGPETIVKYLFTSGSTGAPKAVINTHSMICANQAMVRDCYRFVAERPPVVLDWAPWNHTAGGNKVFYLVMTNGGTFYIDDGRPVSGRFDETLRNLREIACTWYFNVPLGYDLLVEALEGEPALAEMFFRDLGMMFYAGAGMSQITWDRLRAVARRTAGREVLLATGLGATETAPFALACTEVQERAGNVGVPARGLTLKLVPQGGKLEARLKGPTITPGYKGDPAKTAEAFDEEGFYKLGDALRPADPEDFTKGFFFDGRMAENFKLTSGTWVPVGAVRAALVDAMGGLVRDAVIVGENAPELGALLILSEAGAAMAPEAREAALAERLAAAARAATGSASRVRRALVLTEPPSFERGEVTEKGSLNQRQMRGNNAEAIMTLYDGGPGVLTF